jgi:hypothetical protein
MKGFLIKIVLFALLIFLVDKLFIIIRNKAPEFDYDRRLEMVIEGNVNKDIIILGSSRGQRNIDVQLLKDSLNTEKVFNLSYGGSTPEFQEFVLDQLIENNRNPKLIIKLLDDDFELMHQDIDNNSKEFRRDRLYPLVKYEEIRQELIQQGGKSKILSQLFILHQLNRSNFNIIKRGVIDTTFGGELIHERDLSLDWKYEGQPLYTKSNEQIIEIQHLVSFQKKCLENNIKLIFATAPVYRETSDNWVVRMKQLVLPSTMFYVHNINEEAYKEKENFADYSHLNYKGAVTYTQEIINFIKDNNLELY